MRDIETKFVRGFHLMTYYFYKVEASDYSVIVTVIHSK